jgi:hypothetical protein
MASGFRGPERRTSLLGRVSECTLLDGLLSDIRRGESRSLVLRGEAGHRTARGDHTQADLELAEQRVLARREPQVASEHELASRAAGASADRGDADYRGTRQTDKHVDPRLQPGRTGS